MSATQFTDEVSNQVNRPNRVGTSLPTTAKRGEIYFLVGAVNKLYASFATDTWTEIATNTGDAGNVIGAANLITVGAVPYVSATGTLNQDQTAIGQLFWDAANHRLGIGNNAPVVRLEVSTNLTTTPRGIMSSQFNTGTDSAHLHMRKGRGTELAPTIIVTGDNIGRVVAAAYDGANFLEMGSIIFASEGTIAATRIPINIQFWTGTDALPSVLTERLRIDSAGLASFVGTVKISSLTSGRIPFAATGGLLGDDASLLYSVSTSALTVNGNGIGSANFIASNTTVSVNRDPTFTLLGPSGNRVDFGLINTSGEFLPAQTAYLFLSNANSGFAITSGNTERFRFQKDGLFMFGASAGMSLSASGVIGFDTTSVGDLAGSWKATSGTLSSSLTFSVAASGPILKQGANGRVGTFVANGVTPVTVSNTSVAITDIISISLNTVGGTVGAKPTIQTITAGTGFTVAGTALDTSTYNYSIMKNAA